MIKEYYRKRERAAATNAKTPRIFILLEEAVKLMSAIKNNEKEILLLGLVEHEKDTVNYVITRWLVPPQCENTGAYVTTDDEKYHAWLHNMPREERLKMRCHLHTHPKMAVFPSSTDEATLEDQLDNLDDFYIRIIANQKLEMHVDLFDIENHKQYTDLEIVVPIHKYFQMQFSKSGAQLFSTSYPEIIDDIKAKMAVAKPVNYPVSYGHGYGAGADYGVDDGKPSKTYRPGYVWNRETAQYEPPMRTTQQMNLQEAMDKEEEAAWEEAKKEAGTPPNPTEAEEKRKVGRPPGTTKKQRPEMFFKRKNFESTLEFMGALGIYEPTRPTAPFVPELLQRFDTDSVYNELKEAHMVETLADLKSLSKYTYRQLMQQEILAHRAMEETRREATLPREGVMDGVIND